jgi:hypothetical protein
MIGEAFEMRGRKVSFWDNLRMIAGPCYGEITSLRTSTVTNFSLTITIPPGVLSTGVAC